MQSKKQLKPWQILEFLKQRNYEYKKEMWQWGLWRTILLRDPIVDLDFVCKKYSPDIWIGDLYFPHFIQEIRVLHLMYHKNIVRVFNYYLYPEQKTGYILMEYIEWSHIDKYLYKNPDKINDVFTQIIDGFTYLEENNILHRDIRPANIMVSDDWIAKVIDFWFGKKIETSIDNNKSISLNWRYTPPDDFTEWKYTVSTDIYFLWKLFEEIIKNNSDMYNFKYTEPLKRMIKTSSKDRYISFVDIQNEILSIEWDTWEFELSFSEDDKADYRLFAEELLKSLSNIAQDITYNTDIEEIYKKLSQIYKNSMLEDVVYDMAGIINVFIQWDSRYYPRKRMHTVVLWEFLRLLRTHSKEEQKIILDHLRIRISNVDKIEKIDEITIDDIPF